MAQIAAKSLPYIEETAEGYWVAGTRVSLDSLVYAFWNGQTAESIAQSFPTLQLEQVYGAIAYYLAHRAEVDAHLGQRRTEFEAAREDAQTQDPAFYAKLAGLKSRS
jgi:uncharacterized protein (DUF433 family)